MDTGKIWETGEFLPAFPFGNSPVMYSNKTYLRQGDDPVNSTIYSPGEGAILSAHNNSTNSTSVN